MACFSRPPSLIMPRLDRGILFGTQKKDTRVKPGCDDWLESDAPVQLIPNIFRQFDIACIHGFSAAGPWPQMSAGGLVPNIFS